MIIRDNRLKAAGGAAASSCLELETATRVRVLSA